MRSLALLLLALSHLPAAGDVPTPAAAPYVLVRVDGGLVDLAEAPTRKGSAFVAKLWPSGQLVWIKADEVNEPATAEANRAGGRRPQPTPVPTAAPIDRKALGASVPLGDRVKLNASRAEVEKKLQSSSGTAKPDELPERAEPGTKHDEKQKGKVPPPKEHVDTQGRGEAYWRARADKIKVALANAQARLDVAQSSQDRWERETSSGGAAQSTWAHELQKRRDEVGRARAARDQAQRAMDALAEEARKADAFPGWIR